MTPTLNLLAEAVSLQSVTVTPDAMPGHHVARAVIFDLQPSQMVAAILATEHEIKQSYPLAQRTGWRAASDGIYFYFHAWTAQPQAGVIGQRRVA